MVNKIDSNITGLAYAKETSLGVLPATPIWNRLEPNSYNDFGGQLTTIARNPINPTRQRKKGVVTDLDASGGFQSDLTQDNMLELLQGFFFADMRKKGEEAPTSVDGTAEEYLVASTTGFLVGNLILASGFDQSDNNGLKTVVTVTTSTSIEVDEDIVDETSPPDLALLQVVGHLFSADDLDVDVSGSLPELVHTNLVKAAKVFTVSAITAANGQTASIGGQTYTFRSALSAGPTVANEVLIGADVTAMAHNFRLAVNGEGVEGVNYSIGTLPNAFVTATDVTGAMTATAIKGGASGNAIAIAETLTNSAWAAGATFLSGGAGVNFDDLGLIAGEWISVGGDGTGQAFVNAANKGLARIRSVAFDVLTLDKTEADFAAETGTGLTVAIFFGNIIRNETESSLIVRRTYQLERQLGNDGSGVMSEYLVGAVPNTIALNIGTATKLTMDLGFIATDNEQRTGATGVKSGDRPTLVASDAFNTSSDFNRIRMALVSDTDEAPVPLFAFITSGTLNVNNNLSPNKAVSVLGAFDVTAGTFEVSGQVEAYFGSIAAVQAVRDNDDITLDFAIVKHNAGMVFDIPLLALGDGRLKIEADKPVTLPLTVAAAESETFGYTLLYNVFPYLPDLAG